MCKYISIFILILLIGCTTVMGQVQMAANAAQVGDPRTFLVNPAAVAFQERPFLLAGYHLLHTGFSGQIFGKSYAGGVYPISAGSGLGLSGQYFSAHLLRRNELDLSYAHSFGGGKLAVGLNLGLLGISYDRDSFVVEDENDPLLTQNTSKMQMNIGVGALVNPFSTVYLGFGLNHLNQPDISISGSGPKLPVYTNISLFYKHSLFSPFLSFEMDETEGYFNFGVEKRFLAEKARLSILYSPEFLNFAAGYRINNFLLDYTFRYPLSELNTISNGSHEFMVSYYFPQADVDFELEVQAIPPADLTKIVVQAGDSAIFDIRIIPRHNFKQTTVLTLSELPPAIQSRFSAQSVLPLSASRLALTTDSDCPAATYPIELKGTTGKLTHTCPIHLKVVEKPKLLAQVKSSVEKLVVESQEIQEEIPLLNSIFFAENEDRLSPTRYNLSKTAAAVQTQPGVKQDELEHYRNTLNLLGQRLLDNSQIKVTLLGYRNVWGAEKGNQGLGLRRARAIQDYWVNSWGIAANRISIQEKRQPATASLGKLGQEEMQRVEIIPQDASLELLKPTVATYIQSQFSDSACIFSTQASVFQAGVKAWRLEITDHTGAVVRQFKEKEELPAEIVWDWKDRSGQPIPIGNDYRYCLSLTDKIGQTDRTGWQKIETSYQTVQKFKRVQKFRLILFEFDKDQVDLSSPFVKRKIREIVGKAKVSPGARIILKGYTDIIGTPEYNRELSLNRAQSLYERLVQQGIAAHRIHYSGYGQAHPIMSNDLPEGRMLNRRVEVFIQFPED